MIRAIGRFIRRRCRRADVNYLFPVMAIHCRTFEHLRKTIAIHVLSDSAWWRDSPLWMGTQSFEDAVHYLAMEAQTEGKKIKSDLERERSS